MSCIKHRTNMAGSKSFYCTFIIFAQFVSLLFISLAFAEGQGKVFNVTVDLNGAENVVIDWQYPRRSKNVVIYRRPLGEAGVESWRKIAGADFPEHTFTDSGVREGETVEYRVLSERGETSFFCITKHAPLVDYRGGVILVVDETFAKHLQQELSLYEMDLVGDGWDVFRLDWERHDKYNPERAWELRQVLQDYVKQYPQINSVILFGKLPMVKSGNLAPDGHDKRPHETDTYYADIDGQWTDEYLNIEGVNVPGDDIFDQRTFPTALELAVGRITFHDMARYHKTEEEYLRDYIYKVHAWRYGYRKVPLRGVLGDKNNGHFLFGSRNVFWTMFDGDISFDFNSVYEQPSMWLGMIGKVDHTKLYHKGIFCMNFKSYKQTFWKANNPIRALLAQPDWGLVSVWGARPQFYLHHMAAGKTIGYSLLRTQNNGFDGIPEYYPQDYNSLNNVVSTNLQGDPTLRMHQILPPSDLRVTKEQAGVSLSWKPSGEKKLKGYHVYRSTDKLKNYKRLTNQPVTKLNFRDPEVLEDVAVYYQVRAVAETSLPTGTYMNQSQGIFASLAFQDRNPIQIANEEDVSTGADRQLRIHFTSKKAGSDIFPVIIENPQHGRLRWKNGRCYYQALTDFSGVDTIRFLITDGIYFSDVHEIKVQVTGPDK